MLLTCFFLYFNEDKLRRKIKLILTCPIDTLGMGTSETSLSTSGPPNDDTRIAFIAWKLETARGLSNSHSPKTDSARTKKLYQSPFNISKTIVVQYVRVVRWKAVHSRHQGSGALDSARWIVTTSTTFRTGDGEKRPPTTSKTTNSTNSTSTSASSYTAHAKSTFTVPNNMSHACTSIICSTFLQTIALVLTYEKVRGLPVTLNIIVVVL